MSITVRCMSFLSYLRVSLWNTLGKNPKRGNGETFFNLHFGISEHFSYTFIKNCVAVGNHFPSYKLVICGYLTFSFSCPKPVLVDMDTNSLSETKYLMHIASHKKKLDPPKKKPSMNFFSMMLHNCWSTIFLLCICTILVSNEPQTCHAQL